jgi:hypothetical protein
MSSMRSVLASILVWVAVAACGSVNSPEIDACTTASCTIDAAVATDAATLPVTALVIVNGAPIVDADVVFQNADGSLVAALRSDAQGIAKAAIAPGGIVNIIIPAGVSGDRTQSIYTFVGVKPGDQLLIERPTLVPATTAKVVNFPDFGPGNTYDVATTCSEPATSTTPSVTIQLDTGCTTTNLYARVYGNSLKSLYAQNVAIPVAGAIDLTAGLFKVSRSQSFTISNVPAVVTAARINSLLEDGEFDLYAPENTLPQPAVLYPTPLAPTTMTTVPIPDIAVTMMIARNKVTRSNNADQVVIQRVPNAPYTLDFAAVSMPWILSVPALSGSSMVWTQSNDGTAPDLVEARIVVQRATSLRRHVVAPYQPGVLTIPDLPAAFAQYNIIASDVLDNRFPIIVSLWKFAGGYDAVRGRIFVVNAGSYSFVAPGGSAAVSRWIQ